MALLRGVNVGGRNKVPMKDLKGVFEGLGHGDVATYIQSGNVVFTARTRPDATALESAITDAFGVTSAVVVRSASELAKAIDGNPFAKADQSKLHVGFMEAKPPKKVVDELDMERFAPDEAAVVGKHVYLHLPNGMGRAKLPPYIDTRLTRAGTPMTVRNWATVNKLAEMADGG